MGLNEKPSVGGRTAKTGPPHRITQVREAQSVTLRTISRRCGVSVRQLKLEETGQVDLRLSDLQRWAQALEVPLHDLLCEPSDNLTTSVAQRAQLIRIMKTVAALRNEAESSSQQRMADRLRDQLLEIMPELSTVTGWPRDGARRTGPLGRIVECPISLDGFDTNHDSLL